MAREDDKAQAGNKKNPMVKYLILVLLLVLVAGGGYVGWAKFMAGDHEKSKPAPPPQPVMYDAGVFLANLADPGGKRYLKVSIQMEAENQAVSQEINNRTVEVKDLILMLLSSKEYQEIGTANGKMNLKKELLTRLNRMLQSGKIKEIYFTEFLVQ